MKLFILSWGLRLGTPDAFIYTATNMLIFFQTVHLTVIKQKAHKGTHLDSS